MDTTDLCYLSAQALRALYQKREVSPVEVTDAVLDRITSLNPSLGAFITVTAELAREQARTAEAAYALGDAPPLLSGIPTSLKDLTVTKGIRTTRGSLLYKDCVPDFDAPIAERLYAAGIVMLGKTNTPELGWKGDSANRIIGPTHNPWKHGRTAGGSSGGAGAAVAAGLSTLSQGTDGAGSIRIPAAFCGIYGLKPSWGLVPQYPASAVEFLSHAGPMTRTVADAALMLTVMAGAEPRDPTSISTDINYLAAMKGDIAGLRVGWSPDLGYAPVDPEVREIATKAAASFSELGCHVEEVQPGIPSPWENILNVIWSSAFAGVFRDNLDAVRDRIDPGLLTVIERGQQFSAAELAAANARRHDYYHAWRNFMQSYDLLLTPTLPITAFPAGDDHPGEIHGQSTTYLDWTAFTYPFNITGQPAATVPCGKTREGLPVGLQIVGRWRDDVTVLRASAAFEAHTPWTTSRPVA
ncbi:MAG: amidase [Candidatus Poribacteria bacterium]|nr:amidase [Candidatus Poribacteria bacterium]